MSNRHQICQVNRDVDSRQAVLAKRPISQRSYGGWVSTRVDTNTRERLGPRGDRRGIVKPSAGQFVRQARDRFFDIFRQARRAITDHGIAHKDDTHDVGRVYSEEFG